MAFIKKKVLFFVFFAQCSATIPLVEKKQLENGLTILVAPIDTVQKVSMQLIYPVGSKHENSNEKGLAHLIEHMIFKGTEKLSESDIPLITNILSGDCNAFTSFDTTRYLFDLPPQYWKEALPIMADCMQNCTFKEELLNSELKAVIQEMKLNHDNYERALVQKFITAIFAGHPYHYPVIGFKHDLWNLSRERLAQFYKTHYLPNNATLIIVGNVDPKEVFQLAQHHFGSIAKDEKYQTPSAHFIHDICAQSVTLYRDVISAYVLIGFITPGFTAQQHHLIEIIHGALTGGKTTRLNKKLVDDLQLVSSIGSSSYGLFDHDLFTIAFKPNNQEDIDSIIAIINDELAAIAANGLTEAELNKIIKQIQSDQYDLIENNETQATLIAQTYAALGEWEYAFKDHWHNHEQLNNDIKNFVSKHLRTSIMHKAFLLPIADAEKENLLHLQEESDNEDAAVLSGKIRTTPVEPPHYALQLKVENYHQLEYPAAQHFLLSNGLYVSYYHRPAVRKIVALIELKANGQYDSTELPGLYRMMCSMLFEGGTHQHTAEQLADELESNAIGFSITPGFIEMNMLSEDLQKALNLATEILTQPRFNQTVLNKIRTWALQDYNKFITNPAALARHMLMQELFKQHPKAKNLLGTPESIQAITQKDIVEFFQTNISPRGAHLSIVGDLTGYDIPQLLETTLGTWQGPEIPVLAKQQPEQVSPKIIKHQMQRDQVVLCLGGLSIGRLHNDFDKLLLFDYIFGADMNSRLFNLREQTGAFYEINGSLLTSIEHDLSLWTITTRVSIDRLEEAEQLIKNSLENMVESMTENELASAKRAILLRPNDLFSTNVSTAQAFLFLKRYNLPDEFFVQRHQQINALSLEEVKEAVKKVLNKDNMIIIKIGRVS